MQMSDSNGAGAAAPVLFVSPDAGLRAAAVRSLARAGFEVIAVSHAGHASLACIERPDIALLVIEDVLPEGSGSEVALRLERYCPDLHVVRMCDWNQTPGRGVAVSRPFSADDLIAALGTRSAYARRGATIR